MTAADLEIAELEAIQDAIVRAFGAVPGNILDRETVPVIARYLYDHGIRQIRLAMNEHA